MRERDINDTGYVSLPCQVTHPAGCHGSRILHILGEWEGGRVGNPPLLPDWLLTPLSLTPPDSWSHCCCCPVLYSETALSGHSVRRPPLYRGHLCKSPMLLFLYIFTSVKRPPHYKGQFCMALCDRYKEVSL